MFKNCNNIEMELSVNLSECTLTFDTETEIIGSSNETSTATLLSSVGQRTQNELAIENFIYTKLVLAVCLFGICGNLLNLIVLSKKSFVYMMERMERSAHYGLIALAVSDLCVCLATLPRAIYGIGGFAHESFDFRLVYRLYGSGVVNTFILSSTWLTVTMAVSRYIAICHPLRARLIIGKRFTVASLATVFVVSVLFNVPRYLYEKPCSIMHGGRLFYFAYPGPFNRPELQSAYSWSYFVLGIAVPLGLLVFCNVHLIRTLRLSMLAHGYPARTSSTSETPAAETRRTGRESRSEHAASRITITLVGIIVLFLVLFVPAELLNFFVELAVQSRYKKEVFHVAMAIGNLLQTVNFAVNFVLYSTVNTYFRHFVWRTITCAYWRSPQLPETAENGDEPVQAIFRSGRRTAEQRANENGQLLMTSSKSLKPFRANATYA